MLKPHAVQERLAKTPEDHTSVHVLMGPSVTPMGKVVKLQLNVKSMMTALLLPNASNQMVYQSVEMFAKIPYVDLMQNVWPITMWRFVNVGVGIKEILVI